MSQAQQPQKENSSPNARALRAADARFKEQLANSLFDHEGKPDQLKVLSFSSKAPKPPSDYQKELRVMYSQNRSAQPTRRASRHVATSAERVLDAPDLLDDYYVNLLDWSVKNVVAVGLGQALYLWDAASGRIELLLETPGQNNPITSVQWMQAGTHVAVGTTQQEVQLWDVAAQRKVRSMRGHAGRVSSLAWNGHILSSGSRDSEIFNHDVRIAKHHFQTFSGHQQ
jgi:cell division cycle protein 20 (cofactor of APC complex)